MTNEALARRRKLLELIETVARMDSVMPVHRMGIFVAIAAEPDIDRRGLAVRFGLQESSVTRNLYSLAGGLTSSRKRGMHLIRLVEHPDDRRSTTFELTAKGQWFIEKLEQFVEE